MGNKKKRVNTDPTMSMIRDIFQENLQLVNRVQRKSKSDIVTKYDLTEKLCARRMKAVAHLMPEMQERYAKTYPEIDIRSEFADIASLPVLSYDIIDEESYLCLGAAIWMLDQIWEEHEMQELCDLLPEECDYVDIPDVYDARFSDEIIEGMLWIVQNRYGETDRYVVPPNILSKKDDSVFHKILDMIPDRAKEAAAAQLKTKFWEWADLYFKALSPLVHEMRRQEESLDRLTDQIEEIKKKYFPKKQARPTLPLTAPLPLLDDIPIKNQKLEADMLMCQIDKAEEAHNNISKKIGDFRFTGLQAAVMNKDCLMKCMNADLAEEMYNFPVEDPYELCFAILYLFDQDDDYAWVYSFMTAVICRAASMLPWGFACYEEEEDGFWFDDGKWIPSMPLNPEWYETKYAGQRYEDDEEEPHEVSIAQIVYEHTGAILPRNMHRFDDAFRPLKKRGLKPSEANMVCALMDVLGEARRRREYISDGDFREDLDLDSIAQPEKAEKTDSAAEENERLKKELAQLKEQAKKANYNLSRENRELKEKLEKSEAAVGEMTQELADLREIVFNQQSGTEEKAAEVRITFPYHTTRRILAFGGHDSWLREIKFKVPDVRFMGEDISSPEIIRRADVVWIQTNCIGHKSYYNIIDLARRYDRKVRYFKYASASKCAEQIVEEENADE